MKCVVVFLSIENYYINYVVMKKVILKKKDRDFSLYLLDNGWYALTMINDDTKNFQSALYLPKGILLANRVVQYLTLANGNCFLVLDCGTALLYDKSGTEIKTFQSEEKPLFFVNGWYLTGNDYDRALFDENHEIVETGIHDARVFDNGWYIIERGKKSLFRDDKSLVVDNISSAEMLGGGAYYIYDEDSAGEGRYTVYLANGDILLEDISSLQIQ